MILTRWLSRFGTRFTLDPLAREFAKMEQARRKGMANKLRRFNRALREGDEAGVLLYRGQYAHYIASIREDPFGAQVAQGDPPADPGPAPKLLVPPLLMERQVTYLISSMTMADAYAYLTQSLPDHDQEPEWMLAFTGSAHDSLRTLERSIDVKLSLQSFSRAAFDMQDFAQVLHTLHKHGQSLYAIFHSHRFAGAPAPSETDWYLQDHILDKGGYPAIQAVFSEDGYVRFFARRPFTLSIYGKGVECVHPKTHLYRIVQRSTLSFPRPHTPGRNGGDTL